MIINLRSRLKFVASRGLNSSIDVEKLTLDASMQVE